jgi:hypothetical protein
MRGLLALAVVTLCGSAAADSIGVMEPPIVSACSRRNSWPLMLDCFKQHGFAMTVVGALDDANLVSITIVGDKVTLEGYALYVHEGSGPWHLGGLLQVAGNVDDYVFLRLEHLGKRGYRFDVASSTPSSATFAGFVSIPAIYRQVHATFCSGVNSSCVALVPKCVQIARGQAINAFDGTITVHDNTLSLVGVGTEPACSENGQYRFSM